MHSFYLEHVQCNNILFPCKGAMRAAPVALFCQNSSEQELVNIAKDMALITHANKLGYNGTILQVSLSFLRCTCLDNPWVTSAYALFFALGNIVNVNFNYWSFL